MVLVRRAGLPGPGDDGRHDCDEERMNDKPLDKQKKTPKRGGKERFKKKKKKKK